MREPWYKDEVRPLVNNHWTMADRVRIVRLRAIDPEITAREIARHFPKIRNINSQKAVNIIHNQIRIINKVTVDKCYNCGNKLTAQEMASRKPGKLLCLCFGCKQKTQNYKKSLRDKALEKGVCGVCRKEKVIPGNTSCIHCLSMTHRRRYKKDICGQCGEKPIAKGLSTAFCRGCLKHNRKHAENIRKQQALSLVTP